MPEHPSKIPNRTKIQINELFGFDFNQNSSDFAGNSFPGNPKNARDNTHAGIQEFPLNSRTREFPRSKSRRREREAARLASVKGEMWRAPDP